MLEHLGSCKGFFTIKPAQRADSFHTQKEVDAYIDKCIAKNAMAGLDLAGGIGDMWRDEEDKKCVDKGTLLKMCSTHFVPAVACSPRALEEVAMV